MLGALSLARRAGALVAGFDEACRAAARGKAALVLLAGDLSPGTKKRVHTACAGRCPIKDLPLAIEDIAAASGKPAGVLAVTDKNLAALCQGLLEKPAAHEEEPV